MGLILKIIVREFLTIRFLVIELSTIELAIESALAIDFEKTLRRIFSQVILKHSENVGRGLMIILYSPSCPLPSPSLVQSQY